MHQQQMRETKKNNQGTARDRSRYEEAKEKPMNAQPKREKEKSREDGNTINDKVERQTKQSGHSQRPEKKKRTQKRQQWTPNNMTVFRLFPFLWSFFALFSLVLHVILLVACFLLVYIYSCLFCLPSCVRVCVYIYLSLVLQN